MQSDTKDRILKPMRLLHHIEALAGKSRRAHSWARRFDTTPHEVIEVAVELVQAGHPVAINGNGRPYDRNESLWPLGRAGISIAYATGSADLAKFYERVSGDILELESELLSYAQRRIPGGYMYGPDFTDIAPALAHFVALRKGIGVAMANLKQDFARTETVRISQISRPLR